MILNSAAAAAGCRVLAAGLPQPAEHRAEHGGVDWAGCGPHRVRVGQQQGQPDRWRHGAVHHHDAAAVRAAHLLWQLLPPGRRVPVWGQGIIAAAVQ